MMDNKDIMDHKKQCKECYNKYNPKEESSEKITKEQLEELGYELANIPKSKFLMIISYLREINFGLNEEE